MFMELQVIISEVANWNVNDWNSEKKDDVLCFISKFKPVCLCLQEIGNSKNLCNNDL